MIILTNVSFGLPTIPNYILLREMVGVLRRLQQGPQLLTFVVGYNCLNLSLGREAKIGTAQHVKIQVF